jgi:hypothetical protein
MSSNVIELSDLPPIDDIAMNSSSGADAPSNFGLDFLMNPNAKSLGDSGSYNKNEPLDNLDDLENELNALSNPEQNSSNTHDVSELFKTSDVSISDSKAPPISVSPTSNQDAGKFNVKFNSTENINVGTKNNSETWDGYSSTFNNVPLNPEAPVNDEPKKTKEQLFRDKQDLLIKIRKQERKGIVFSQSYNSDSSYIEMKCEYDAVMKDLKRDSSVAMISSAYSTILKGLEYFTTEIANPLDAQLDGLGDLVDETISDHDDLFGRFADKWMAGETQIPVEAEMIFAAGYPIIMVHMTNLSLKNAPPEMEKILRSNPELLSAFQSAAMQEMQKSAPGVGKFVNETGNMRTQHQRQPQPQNQYHQPTYNDHDQYHQQQQPHSHHQLPPPLETQSREKDKSSSLRNPERSARQPVNANKSSRSEMAGPGNISDILDGIKTKKTFNPPVNIDIQTQSANNDSMISIHDMKELHASNNTKLPKKNGKKSSRTKTISLDL